MPLRLHAKSPVLHQKASGNAPVSLSRFQSSSLLRRGTDFLQLIRDTPEGAELNTPCSLLALLVNYNKFEFQNPYQMRLEDFVNDATIRHIAEGMGQAFASMRDAYLLVQDDLTEGWGLSSPLSLFGLGSAPPSPKGTARAMSEQDLKSALSSL